MGRTLWTVAWVGIALLALPAWSASPANPIGGGFTLVDQDGKVVTDRSFHGRPVLLYFGFTACPDVCPTDLARLVRIAQRVRALGGPPLKTIFVSVDPARDTPSKMKAYVSLFGPDVIGLTGTPAQIAAVTDRYHVYYQKVPYGKQGQYMMDHSTFVFLLDREGRYVDHFGRTADEAAVAGDIAAGLGGTSPRAHAARQR